MIVSVFGLLDGMHSIKYMRYTQRLPYNAVYAIANVYIQLYIAFWLRIKIMIF